MSESMFGRPSQHLLPSHPSASAGGGSDPHTVPIQPAPVKFKDFRFNSIGKQPDLLSRISLPQPDHTDYHSSTPSPTSTPPHTFTNNGAFQSSRPTLYQQLAGGDSDSMDGALSWQGSTSQANRSLASRIQMNGSPSNNNVVNTARSTASRFPSPPSRVHSVNRAAGDASLIPPVEFLSQPPESSPPTPTSLAPTSEPVEGHSLMFSSPLMNTTTLGSSRIPTPVTVTTSATSREPTGSIPSSAIVDAMMQDSQPSPSTVVTTDSLAAQQERLQAISTTLANMASSFPSAPQSSSSPGPPASRANDNITPYQSSQQQHSSVPIVLCHPYMDNQFTTNTNDSSLAPVQSPTTLLQAHQTQGSAVIEAFSNLNSTINAVHRAQIDVENALAFQIRTFEDQRGAFEQTKRAEEARLHQEFQELQQKREELNVKEASLVSLEQESKTREVARKAMLAKRQAQEAETRASEAKKRQEVQEQILAAMNELKGIEAMKAKGQLGQLTNETVPDELPTDPQEGMDEEEIAVIKSRNDLLRALKHLRRMHSDKVQKLEESNRTLRRLEEERKQREAEEAERRRLAEEERLRAHAEAERARQVLDEKRRQFEAESKHQEVENKRERARILVEQAVHADAQVHGLRRTETTSDQTLEHLSYPEEVSASQQQGIADITRIRAAPEASSFSSEITVAMTGDEDGEALAPPHTVPLSDIHTSPGGSHCTIPQPKQKDSSISGGVILAITTPNTSGGHLPPKPSAKLPVFSSERVTENALNPAKTSPAISVSAEGGHGSSSPPQLPSQFNRAVNTDIRLTPEHKSTFSRTPKSQTILGASDGGSEELNIGPCSGLSPAQQNVNLRHLKRYRGRVEENDSGDRSVRSNVKNEENAVSLKGEGQDDHFREQASLSTNPPASLPPRPAIITPPRPWKRLSASAVQAVSARSYPPDSYKLALTKGRANIINRKQAVSGGSPSSQAVNASIQLPVSAETTNSPSDLVHSDLHSAESRTSASERPQDRVENRDTTSSESASATLSHELDREDLSRSNVRFTDEHRGERNEKSSHRLSDHHSPWPVTSRSKVTSPTQPPRLINSWRPENPSSGPRAETTRATSPTTGRKRPCEFNDNEHGHRARRQRGDVWVAQDYVRDPADSHRLHQARHPDSEPHESRAPYRAPASLPDHTRSYPSDIPRANHDNRSYDSPLSEATTPLVARWEQSHRRQENEDTYLRYPPSLPGYNPVTGQYPSANVRVGQTYEPMMEERTDGQPDPSLLTRMRNTQRLLPSNNIRSRARVEPNRGRGDFGRGRGRGIARGGTPLLERLTSGPSLEDRLT